MSNTKNLANLAAALDDGTANQLLKSTGSGGVDFTSIKTVGGESILGSGDIAAGVVALEVPQVVQIRRVQGPM